MLREPLTHCGLYMFCWYRLAVLSYESNKVINMRLHAVVLGKCTSDEMVLMFTEKMDAVRELQAIVARGGDPTAVVEHYRRIVAANVARLSD